METYPYPPSYPDSGDSSPRSREIDFENPAPWEDSQNPQQSLASKVKFMCSYGGKIHPRPHDNLLSYVGGETKILAVDRNITFASLIAKLSSLCDCASVSFKYQLPGEDLDALISVTNDDDLEHMMHEYDRLYRASPKPARLRLFLFPASPAPPSQSPTVVGARSFGSDDQVIKSEKERFVEALNSGPIQTAPPPSAVAASPPQTANVDFLFGLEKGMVPPPLQQQQQHQHLQSPPLPAGGKLRDPAAEQALHEHEIPGPALDDRVMGSDSIQKHIQDLQRLRIEEQQGLYRRKSDDNLAGGYPVGGGGEYYVQKVPEKVAPVSVPGTMAIPTAGYWPPEKQVAGGVFPASTFGTDQQVYMIPAPAGAYHPQMVRPVTGPTGQGYYTVQRVPEMYREQQQQQQQPYNVAPQMGAPVQSAPPPSLAPQGPPTKITAGGGGGGGAYTDGYGMVRPATSGGVGVTETGYGQVAYDSGLGRQVYYAAQGGVNVMGGPSPQAPPQQAQQYHHAMAASTAAATMGDVRALNQEAGKVVPKATQASV